MEVKMISSFDAIVSDQRFQRLINGSEHRSDEFFKGKGKNFESLSLNEFLRYLPFVILLEHRGMSLSQSKEEYFRKIRDAKNDPELVYYGSFFNFRIKALTNMMDADLEQLNQVDKVDFITVSAKYKEKLELRERINQERDDFLVSRLVRTVVSSLYSPDEKGRYNQKDITDVAVFLEGEGERAVTIHDDDNTGTIFFKISDMSLFVDYMTKHIPLLKRLYLADFKEICDVKKLVDYLKSRPEANTLEVDISVELSEASRKIFENSGLNIVYFSPKYTEESSFEEESKTAAGESRSPSMEHRETSEESGVSSC